MSIADVPVLPPPSGTVPAVLVETRTALGDASAAWDALVDASSLPSPFLRSWWLDAFAGPGARFVLAHDGRRLIGGLALATVERAGVVRHRLLGAGRLAPDHLDVLAGRGDEAAALAALAAWWREQGPCVVDLVGVAAGARVAALVPGRPDVRRLSVAPYVALPGDPGELLGRVPSRLRSSVERAGRRLGRAGVTHRVARRPAEVEAALPVLLRLHRERWPSGSNFARGFATFAAAARRGAERGEVAIHELGRDEQVVASMVVLETAGRLSYYQSGRATDHEWRGSGNVLMWRVLDDGTRRGFTELDLLRGDEPYKWEWATGERPVLALRSAVGIGPRTLVSAQRVWDRARPVLRQAGAGRVRRLARRRRRSS